MTRTFEEKIAFAVEKVKGLKEEKNKLDKRIDELEDALEAKDQEIERLAAEKATIKGQIESLLNILESLEAK